MPVLSLDVRARSFGMALYVLVHIFVLPNPRREARPSPSSPEPRPLTQSSLDSLPPLAANGDTKPPRSRTSGAMEPIFSFVSGVRPSQLRSIHQGNIDCSFDNLRALNSSSPLATTSFSLLYPFSFVNGTHGPSVIAREQE